MHGDPISALNEAVEQFEADRRRSIDALVGAQEALESARRSRSGAAAKGLAAAAKEVDAAGNRVSRLQFHGSYKGTNASFLPATDRRFLAGMALATAAFLAAWVFLIATLAAARLETGQTLALGGLGILVAVVGGFLVIGMAMAYGFKSVHIELRSVDGEIAEVDRADENRARKRLERQLVQATKDVERANKRAEAAANDAAAAREATRRALAAAEKATGPGQEG